MEPKTNEQNNENTLHNTFIDEHTPRLTDGDKLMCERNLSLEEIGGALKELKNGKLPGNDGFTTDFYKFFWIKIKTEVLNSLMYADQIELSTEQKRGVINLIPKKQKDNRYLKNWKPISLLNNDYKILTKALATRF